MNITTSKINELLNENIQQHIIRTITFDENGFVIQLTSTLNGELHSVEDHPSLIILKKGRILVDYILSHDDSIGNNVYTCKDTGLKYSIKYFDNYYMYEQYAEKFSFHCKGVLHRENEPAETILGDDIKQYYYLNGKPYNNRDEAIYDRYSYASVLLEEGWNLSSAGIKTRPGIIQYHDNLDDGCIKDVLFHDNSFTHHVEFDYEKCFSYLGKYGTIIKDHIYGQKEFQSIVFNEFEFSEEGLLICKKAVQRIDDDLKTLLIAYHDNGVTNTIEWISERYGPDVNLLDINKPSFEEYHYTGCLVRCSFWYQGQRHNLCSPATLVFDPSGIIVTERYRNMGKPFNGPNGWSDYKVTLHGKIYNYARPKDDEMKDKCVMINDKKWWLHKRNNCNTRMTYISCSDSTSLLVSYKTCVDHPKHRYNMKREEVYSTGDRVTYFFLKDQDYNTHWVQKQSRIEGETKNVYRDELFHVFHIDQTLKSSEKLNIQISEANEVELDDYNWLQDFTVCGICRKTKISFVNQTCGHGVCKDCRDYKSNVCPRCTKDGTYIHAFF